MLVGGYLGARFSSRLKLTASICALVTAVVAEVVCVIVVLQLFLSAGVHIIPIIVGVHPLSLLLSYATRFFWAKVSKRHLQANQRDRMLLLRLNRDVMPNRAAMTPEGAVLLSASRTIKAAIRCVGLLCVSVCCCHSLVIKCHTRMICRRGTTKTMLTRVHELRFWDSVASQRRIMRGIVYLLLGIIILFTAYMNVLYGITFTSAQNIKWLTSIGVSVAISKAVVTVYPGLFACVWVDVLVLSVPYGCTVRIQLLHIDVNLQLCSMCRLFRCPAFGHSGEDDPVFSDCTH